MNLFIFVFLLFSSQIVEFKGNDVASDISLPNTQGQESPTKTAFLLA